MATTAGIDALVEKISRLPQAWHAGGTVNAITLRTIARHAAALGTIEHSAETGSGRTTLLFSHLSADHRVFALDEGDSVGAVRRSDLLKPGTVSFIEGPTQVTMPLHAFPASLQLALIDGPHGYPFPDLEYWHLYPRIATDGLLMVDDILIPTIRRMFEVIRADDMFELLEVVDRNLAVFRRTTAPLIDPNSDSWWLQGYNRAHYERTLQPRLKERAVDAIAGRVPGGLKDVVPARLKEWIWRRRSS